MDIRNCRECGKIFNYIGFKMCPECRKAKEEKLQEVQDFVREHPDSGIAKVAEEMGVSIAQINQWVREERLILSAAAIGDAIVCESCGKPIQSGHYCDNCKRTMSKELENTYAKPHVMPEKEGKDKTAKKERMRFLDK